MCYSENNVNFSIICKSKNCTNIICLIFACSGDIVTMECVEKIIKKDWIHPLTNEKLTEKDIILLQRVSSLKK